MHSDSFIFWLEFAAEKKHQFPTVFLFIAGPAACGWPVELSEQSLVMCGKRLPMAFQLRVPQLELLRFGTNSRERFSCEQLFLLINDYVSILVQFSLV